MKKLQQAFECGALTFGDDFHGPVRAVANPAEQTQSAGHIQCGVTKADALNGARDDGVEPLLADGRHVPILTYRTRQTVMRPRSVTGV